MLGDSLRSRRLSGVAGNLSKCGVSVSCSTADASPIEEQKALKQSVTVLVRSWSRVTCGGMGILSGKVAGQFTGHVRSGRTWAMPGDESAPKGGKDAAAWSATAKSASVGPLQRCGGWLETSAALTKAGHET
jgi:hypothetical protein